MVYDDLKEYNGQKYMGMTVGGKHKWNYPSGVWTEEKVAPDKWVFTFTSTKCRNEPAPESSGAPVDTQYRWCILAVQRSRKLDKDTYETVMEGLKFKIAHKKPYWRKWSSEYPDNPSDKQRITAILEDMLERVKEGGLTFLQKADEYEASS